MYGVYNYFYDNEIIYFVLELVRIYSVDT